MEMIWEQAFDVGLKAVGAIAILVGGYLGARLVRRWMTTWFARTKMALTLQRFLTQLTYAAILTFALLATLSQFGIETASFIAVLGASGFAVGFALQGSLSNFAAGVLLLVLRPFKIGDFVEAGGVMGSVRDIQLFNSVLATPDNVKVLVPNAQIYGGVIRNFNGYATRRLDLSVGIAYGASIGDAFSAAQELMANDPRVHDDPAPQVMVTELADSSVNLRLRMWVDGSDFWAVNFDMTRAVKEAFDERGIEIPFPQRVVHMRQEND